MINITTENNTVRAAVLGEFSIADFHEFEETILYGIKFQGTVNLLIDLRDMLDFTIDVAWEEIRFSRAHATEFGKIAIITSNQWLSWSAWINQLFVEAEIMVFDAPEAADAWLKEA